MRALIEGYYREVMRFASFSPYSITGHFDLVTKFVEKEGWSFEEEKERKKQKRKEEKG